MEASLLNIKSIKQALNPAFLKQKHSRDEIELFKKEFGVLLDRINPKESEEYHKNLLKDFLNAVYYRDKHYINTKGRADLVVHNDSYTSSPVGVLIETKSPANKTEMPRRGGPDPLARISTSPTSPTSPFLNVKSFHEIVLYYLRERKTGKNFELRYLIITNVYEWFVFDAQDFEKLFYQNKTLLYRFEQFQAGKLSGTSTDFFYKEIISPEVEKIQHEIPFTHVDIRDYQKIISSPDAENDRKLITLYKFFSPVHLLKRAFAHDSNQLNREFYSELLHIIGLEEVTKDNLKIIVRKKEGDRSGGSLIENAIERINAKNKWSNLPPVETWRAASLQFEVALELAITWINRILFLKLLESQILKYHKGNREYAFLSYADSDGARHVATYQDLDTLFFSVLAQREDDRTPGIRSMFPHVPYLNSSLFEMTDMENKTICIDSLLDNIALELYPKSVLYNRSLALDVPSTLRPAEYLLRFLDAFDFSSEGDDDMQEANKPLISASVLGLIFEKINGYQDGSFFTPSFITMYMCRETLQKAVIRKFNEAWSATGYQPVHTMTDLYNRISDIQEANAIFNSLRICDPSVGSGHFLVSALNEMIFLKSELGLLMDKNGKRLKDYRVIIENDELIVTDKEGNFFAYNPKDRESQRVQETLFHEKQTIIENCLFGVDINPNSVKICQLRLWIELLKHAYYIPVAETRRTTSLQTLPNIDINIKCGNSLMSRFNWADKNYDVPALELRLKSATQKYKEWVSLYKRVDNKESKRQIVKVIENEKAIFYQNDNPLDPDYASLKKAQSELLLLTVSGNIAEFQSEQWKKKTAELTEKVDRLEAAYNEKKRVCFEWRFEFPEVLDDTGNFEGFDAVIGNPPYIRLEQTRELSKALESQNYRTFDKRGDLYGLFVERGFQLLRPGGYASLIIPNKWMQTGYGKPVRELFLSKRMLNLVDFGNTKVFDEAGITVCVYLAQNLSGVSKIDTQEPENNDLDSCFTISVLPSLTHSDYQAAIRQTAEYYDRAQFSGEPWVIAPQREKQLFNKIHHECLTLESFIGGEACRGIVTGLTEAFIIDEPTRDRLITEDDRSADLLKPVLRGRDIKPYLAAEPTVYLITTFPSLKIDIERYPAIKNYLLTNYGYDRLKQTGENGARKKTGNQWFETQDTIAYYPKFACPKIMYQTFQRKPCFLFDEKGLFCNNSMWIIPTDDLALLGILNSRMGWWLTTKCCSNLEGMYQLIWQYFGKFPVPVIPPEQRRTLATLVKEILAVKAARPAADTAALEQQIDEIVYRLYGLMSEETALIDVSEI